ncbi:sensor domain-containing protein [Thiohalobacter sp.]|uniref:sensor domain-containing protein n=1 Tax=Thiohalobacter sp. TaxID=2025948 RepID=UPI00261111CD|nr:EAL domain-containing protein [Thiohalobacter sp.]
MLVYTVVMRAPFWPSSNTHFHSARAAPAAQPWRFWLFLAFGPLLFAGSLYWLDIPERLRHEQLGQQAIRELDVMRRPLLDIKRQEVALVSILDQQPSRAPELEQAIHRADLQIDRFQRAGAYNPELAGRIERFAARYGSWVSTLRHLAMHADGRPDEHGIVQYLNQAEQRFLATMNALGDCEEPVHDDIHDGQQAVYQLQMATGLLAFYVFLLILLYQRAVTRAVSDQEKQLSITLQSIGDGVIVTDTAGRVTRMNPLAENMTGWTLEEARNRPISEIFVITNAETGATVENPVLRVLHEGTIVGLANHTVLTARDGTRRQIADSGAPIRDHDDQLHGAVLVFRDVTRDYELRQALQEHAERLDRILGAAMDAVVVADEHGTILEWNPQAERLFGFPRTDAIGSTLHELIIPQRYREAHRQAIERRIRDTDGEAVARRMETEALHRDGHEFPVELSVTQLHQSQGWLFCAFIRDLSDKKRAEAALKKHSLQLAEAQRLAQLGSWELDLRHDRLDWSDEMYRILELDPKAFSPSHEAFLGFVHPEDRERLNRAYRESVERKRNLDITHRLLLADGRIKHVHQRCETHYDADGNPLHSVGTMQDVSASVELQEELRLAATTFNSHAGILITDRDNRILRVNPAFEAMTGYSAEELVGKNPRILKSGRQDENFYKHMWSVIDRTGQWSGELWNKRKDGSLYAEMLTITAVRNDAGEVTHYVGTTQDITERKRAESRVEHLAYHDDLTGLANRRLLHDRLQRELAVARRHSAYGALLFIDLDRFKHLNDALGHPVGDELLRQLARRFTDIMRTEDTVARLGGDEFVFILPAENKDLSQVGFEAQAVAEKILEQVARPFDLNGHRYHITASVGIVLFPEADEDADDVLKHADTALYRAKEDGRNTVRFYQPSMQAAANARLALEKDLRAALELGQFELHYQPQTGLKGHIVALEALIRWQHPERGLVAPDTFIPVAEETGLILEIGNWVLRTAVRQFHGWLRDGTGRHLRRLAINVSPRQFHQGSFTDQVIEICKDAGLGLDFIELEITEGMLMSRLGDTIEKMTELRTRGIRFAIDDFGTGYSSLSYLKRLPLDALKIDRSFVRDIVSDPNDAAIVDTIIAMARHLDLGVIAEGVESDPQREFLRDKGCECFQGYYYSRPVPAREVPELLRAGRLPPASSD